MIPICWEEISTFPAGTDVTLRLYGKIRFPPGKAGQFSTWYLFRFVYINYPLRRTETITWENFVPAVQKRDPVLPGRNFSHVKLFTGYNLERVYNTAGIPAKRDRVSSRPTGIM